MILPRKLRDAKEREKELRALFTDFGHRSDVPIIDRLNIYQDWMEAKGDVVEETHKWIESLNPVDVDFVEIKN